MASRGAQLPPSAAWETATGEDRNGSSGSEPLLILGLDPGSLHTGYGVLERRGSRLRSVDEGRFSFPARHPLAVRLAALTAELGSLLERWRPAAAVLESPFHGLNTRSLIVLAQARGAILALLASRGVAIEEYTPAQVKRAITGNGRADKQQVARMVQMLLSLHGKELASDTTDALAMAICYAQRYQMDRVAARLSGD